MTMFKSVLLLCAIPCVLGLRLADPQDGMIPKEIIEKYASQMHEAEIRLETASDPNYVPPDMGMYVAKSGHNKDGSVKAPNNRFEAVKVELPLEPPLIHHIPIEMGEGEKLGFGGKNLVGLDYMKKNGCVVYAMGIAGNSKFEELMASSVGCEVHAFDCTITESSKGVKGKPFKFHNWCIGKAASTYDGNYLHNKGQLVFKTLAESMKELGHTTMDLLKFDIEGFEWQLFENELLSGEVLPKQLSFEMHTEGAKPWAVPKENTEGRRNYEVNNVFLKLHKLGYRVASKELNKGDHACAEFVLVRV